MDPQKTWRGTSAGEFLFLFLNNSLFQLHSDWEILQHMIYGQYQILVQMQEVLCRKGKEVEVMKGCAHIWLWHQRSEVISILSSAISVGF